MSTNIRRATANDVDAMTALSLLSKAHWGYSQGQMDAWQGELRVSDSDISEAESHLAIVEQTLAGFYVLRPAGKARCLQHFWVAPAYMGRGVGRALLEHAIGVAAGHNAKFIEIDSDPNAEAFYLAFGAVRTGEVAAAIAGDLSRVRPQLQLDVAPDTAR